MKQIARSMIIAILGNQVRRLYKKNPNLKVVGVTGSVGKTSTKLAIAKILSQKYKTIYQDGNYNDIVTVPLIFFGQGLPSLFNPIAWLKVIITNEIKLLGKYPYDIAVVEIGTDGPGQIKKYARYLKLEIGVLTAVTPEHMEYFDNLDQVAAEEKEIINFSSLLLVNKDMVDAQYLPDSNYLSYSINNPSDYKISNLKFDEGGCSFEVYSGDTKIFSGSHEAISEPLIYSILAGVSVAHKMGLDSSEIEAGIASIKPSAGRMQILNGINNSKIIDDSYNASPEAVKAALATLYRINAPQKIALLGNMNELGNYSEQEHRAIGKLCDPKKVDLVITLGPDANKYIAEEAKNKGCNVVSFNNPYDTGKYLKENIKENGLVLVKGSQNKVYAEEAIKEILDDPIDVQKLVRQSSYWLKRKAASFK